MTNIKIKRKKRPKGHNNYNFQIFENAFEFFHLLSQGTTILKIRIPGQKMWAG